MIDRTTHDDLEMLISHVQAGASSPVWDAVKRLREAAKCWIDVRDRLPDLKVPVLVALTLSGKRYVTIGRRSERTWRDNHGYDLEYYDGNVVTHWTPLPDLPEREPALAYEANV